MTPLASAKAKIQALVARHLESLAIQRRNGITIYYDDLFDASRWQSACQTFMDSYVLPELSFEERKAVLRAGLSKLANKLIEDVVRKENKRTSVAAHNSRTLEPGKSHAPVSVRSGLIIRQQPLERILSRKKDWEMRSVPTSKRETIALIEKGTKAIHGLADIVDCLGPLSRSEMLRNMQHHGIDESRLDDPEVIKWNFAYVLENVRTLTDPVACEVRPGAVTFVNLDSAAVDQVLQLLS
jgi:hypothetical protein